MKNLNKILILILVAFSLNATKKYNLENIGPKTATVVIFQGAVGASNRLHVQKVEGKIVDTNNNKLAIEPEDVCVIFNEPLTQPISPKSSRFNAINKVANSNVVIASKPVIACKSGKVFNKITSRTVPTTSTEVFNEYGYLGAIYNKSNEEVSIPENSTMEVYFNGQVID